MTFKELPFKEPIRSDFELIANRIHERFPNAKFYTNVIDGLGDTKPDFTVSGLSNHDLETISLDGISIKVWIDPDEFPGDGIYLSACDLDAATIEMCHYVEVFL